MAEIVREADPLDQISVDEEIRAQQSTLRLQKVTDRASNLGNLDGMREPRPIEIVLPRKKHLRLRLQFPEGLRVNDPVAIDLECAAIVGFAFTTQGLNVE